MYSNDNRKGYKRKDELMKRRARRRCADSRVEKFKRNHQSQQPRSKRRRRAVAEPLEPAQGNGVQNANPAESPSAPQLPQATAAAVGEVSSELQQNPQAVGPLEVNAAPVEDAPIMDFMRRSKVGVPWGRAWVLADTTKYGLLISKTATCLLHRCEGKRCNKWISISDALDADGAEHRLKEWAIRGKDIPDGPGARDRHMNPPNTSAPRTWKLEDLRSVAELDTSAMLP